MAKTSSVLRSLGILGSEEMLKLSEVLKEKQVPMKMAAGEELVVWDDSPGEMAQKRLSPSADAKILEFPTKSIREFSAYEPERPEGEEQDGKLLPSDLVLWQREISRESGANIQKLNAMSGYQKSTQMYVVKTKGHEGKTKLRFASTEGILVNKKQA